MFQHMPWQDAGDAQRAAAAAAAAAALTMVDVLRSYSWSANVVGRKR
jgi:hypothetical protein